MRIIAATSQELASQATALMALVSKFRLKDTSALPMNANPDLMKQFLHFQ